MGTVHPNNYPEVEGWMFDGDLDHLRELAFGGYFSAPHTPILEIGSYCGLSTLVLSEFAHVDCVDPFRGGGDLPIRDTYDDFVRNLATHYRLNHVEAYRERSASFFANRPTRDRYRMAFIDGSHVYEDVVADIYGCLEAVVAGGVVVLDDYAWLDQWGDCPVRRAADRFGFAPVRGTKMAERFA